MTALHPDHRRATRTREWRRCNWFAADHAARSDAWRLAATAGVSPDNLCGGVEARWRTRSRGTTGATGTRPGFQLRVGEAPLEDPRLGTLVRVGAAGGSTGCADALISRTNTSLVLLLQSRDAGRRGLELREARIAQQGSTIPATCGVSHPFAANRGRAFGRHPGNDCVTGDRLLASDTRGLSPACTLDMDDVSVVGP